jgi:D-tagatose-1,6-bisphosphate aldolase subunit GatZ/KbaZ
MENLSSRELPDPLVSAFLPIQYARVRRGDLARSPRELVIDHVRDILRTYAAATGSSASR